jgi:hypothetical protein
MFGPFNIPLSFDFAVRVFSAASASFLTGGLFLDVC